MLILERGNPSQAHPKGQIFPSYAEKRKNGKEQ
jgi:hypothetical protein